MNHFLDSSSSFILGDKRSHSGPAPKLTVIPAPLTAFLTNQNSLGGFFIFISFSADCIIQTRKRKKAVWEGEEGFLGS